MNKETVLKELEAMATPRLKRQYEGNGAKEPVWGVATGKMKPLAKAIGTDQGLADQLYETGNYDAMYFAGIIADPETVDYEKWVDAAYFYMLSDYVVAVTLAECSKGEEIAQKWINSKEELRRSAGWSCYCWMLGNRKDETFQQETISRLLEQAKKEIHEAPERAKAAMNLFISTVGISYWPLHEKALSIAKEIGTTIIAREKKKPLELNALAAIEKEMERGKIGFKRKYVRC